MKIQTRLTQTMVKTMLGSIILYSNKLKKLNQVGDNINKLKKRHMDGVSGRTTLGLNRALHMGMKMVMVQVVKISQLSPCCGICVFSSRSTIKMRLIGVLLSKQLKRNGTIWFRNI